VTAEQAQGQWPLPDAVNSVTFWTQVGQAFKNDPATLFELYNEPYEGTADAAAYACWLDGCTNSTAMQYGGAPDTGETIAYQTAGMQQLVNAIRSTGATNPIGLSDDNWSDDPCNVEEGGTCNGGL
jgi:endoglucanase